MSLISNHEAISKLYVDKSIQNLKISMQEEMLKVVSENKKLSDRVHTLESEIEFYQFEIDEFHKRIYDIEIELYESQQLSRKYNFELSGIPDSVCDENLEVVCIGILSDIVQHPIDETMVDICQRIENENYYDGIRPVLIRLTSKKQVDEIKAMKDLIKTIDIEKYDMADDVKLSITDNLPPCYQTILYYCRVLRRDGKIAKMVTEDREIKIKLLSGKCWHTIRHKQMLVDLFPDFEFRS